jgi:hypothetical protein
MKVANDVICASCHGLGRVPLVDPNGASSPGLGSVRCHPCFGTGYVPKKTDKGNVEK